MAASQLVLKDIPAETVKALSKAFGNFDRVVGLGRLLADAVGHPLLEHSRAHAVGLSAKYEAGKLKASIDQYKRDARRDAGKLGSDDPKRQDLLAQAASAEDAAPLLPLQHSGPGASAPPVAVRRWLNVTGPGASAPPMAVHRWLNFSGPGASAPPVAVRPWLSAVLSWL